MWRRPPRVRTDGHGEEKSFVRQLEQTFIFLGCEVEVFVMIGEKSEMFAVDEMWCGILMLTFSKVDLEVCGA